MDFNDFKRAVEDWARPERSASVFVTQDGVAHAAITVMPIGKVVGVGSSSFRIKFSESNALTDATTRIRGIIDGFYD